MRRPFEAARTWGGARRGGRKPRGRPSMPHATRPKIAPRCPVPRSRRATPELPSLRSARVFDVTPTRHALSRSLSGDPFFDPAGRTGTSSSRGMRRAAPAAACTGWRSGWRSRSTAPSAAQGRSSAIGITPERSRRRGTCGPAWSTCCSTSGSTSAPPRASIRGARVRTSRGGITPRLPPTSRRPRPSRRPGWRASDGGARAVRCGWRNTAAPPRPHPT